MNKPIIAVDIDDVLANFTDPYLGFLESQGIVLSKDKIVGSFTEMWLAGELSQKFYDTGAWSQMQVILGSQEAIQRLAGKFSIIAVTSRDETNTTLDWMKKNFSGVQVVFSRHKGERCEKLVALVLVDDQIQYLKQYTSVAIAQPWNNGYEGVRGDWEFITKHILSLI